MSDKKTAIVTGRLTGIGAGSSKRPETRLQALVANSRTLPKQMHSGTANVALVDGTRRPAHGRKDCGYCRPASVGSMCLVNNAGILFPKPFTEYTTEI